MLYLTDNPVFFSNKYIMERGIRLSTIPMSNAEDIPDTAYADHAPFAVLFGNGGKPKILSAFVAERGRELTISEIARFSGVARSTVYEHIDDLEELGVIEHTRKTNGGHSPLYQLNEDTNIADLLFKLEGTILSERLCK